MEDGRPALANGRSAVTRSPSPGSAHIFPAAVYHGPPAVLRMTSQRGRYK